MQIYSNSINICETVILKKMNFQTAVKKLLILKDFAIRQKIITLCGTFLRHYFFAEALSEYTFNTKEAKDICVIGLCFCDNCYKHYHESKFILNYLKSYFSEKNELSDKQIQDFINASTLERKYNFKDVKIGSDRYFSIKYNLPIRIVKTVSKQYGKDIFKKFINSITKMPKQYVVKNNFTEFLESDFDVLNDKYTLVGGNFYEYKENTSIRKEELVKNYKVFPIQIAAKDIFNNLINFNGGSIACYIGYKSYEVFEVINEFGETNDLSILFPSKKDFSYFGEYFKKLSNVKSLFVGEAPNFEFLANISSPADIFFYFPKNSCIENLRRVPDYGIYFNTQDLDSIIENEKKGLEEACKNIASKGYLVYAVSTINIKETLSLIRTFKDTHKDFILLNEKIYFPYEKENSCYYYAILRKLN